MPDTISATIVEETLSISLEAAVVNQEAFGGTVLNDFVAAEAISAIRVIYNNAGQASPADSTNAAHSGSILGITLTSVLIGNTVSYVSEGRLTTPGESWDQSKPLFFDNLGRLTQTPPASGFSMIVGVPVAADKIDVRISQPIILG